VVARWLTLSAVSGAAALAIALSTAGASVHGDPADAAGPLDLAGVELDQHAHQVVFVAHAHTPLPGTDALSRFPSHVGSTDQRYLCLEVRGSHTKPKLLCPGGKAKHRRVRIGRSKLNAAGQAHKEGSFPARVKRSDSSVRLRFSMRAARLHPGSLSWSALSNWTGPECAKSSPPTPSPPGEGPPGLPLPLKSSSGSSDACLDADPDGGEISGRLFPVQRVGCRPRGGVHFAGPRGKRRVALTFDDGPSAYTAKVISILDHHHAKGTFFEVGQEVHGRSAVMRKALKKGNELGNHTMHHRFAGVADLRATSNLIRRASGFRPCLFRPPGGSRGESGAAHAAGMATILWDIDTRDWASPGYSAIYHSAIGARPGSIVLMHDGGGFRGQTVAALPRIIRTLRARNLKLVTVTKLLGGRYIYREVHH
jgi:peptidoglycan/xylan/chitin deacetylase (PgdA/CDA1 family)